VVQVGLRRAGMRRTGGSGRAGRHRQAASGCSLGAGSGRCAYGTAGHQAAVPQGSTRKCTPRGFPPSRALPAPAPLPPNYPMKTLMNERPHQYPAPCQVVNLVSNRVVRVIGRVENTERFLRVALWQGAPRTRKLPTGALRGLLGAWHRSLRGWARPGAVPSGPEPRTLPTARRWVYMIRWGCI
jgi:hypothetical protein